MILADDLLARGGGEGSGLQPSPANPLHCPLTCLIMCLTTTAFPGAAGAFWRKDENDCSVCSRGTWGREVVRVRTGRAGRSRGAQVPREPGSPRQVQVPSSPRLSGCLITVDRRGCFIPE